ncbi:MAG: hypothetical protein JRN15_06700 [Nitrososphaerota archaeon]|nr:hypothetical protein [Nitrososphaerota archaeon]
MESASSVKDDVIGASEKWYSYLTGSEKEGRWATAVLCGVLVFLGSLLITIASDATSFKLTDYFFQYGSELFFEVAGVASICSGLIYYMIARRRKSKYTELHELIERAKIEGPSRPEIMIELINAITSILPKVRDSKRDTAFFLGVLAFFLTAFLFPYNLVLALVVWLYFRYEASSEFNREITRFDNWKLKFQS